MKSFSASFSFVCGLLGVACAPAVTPGQETGGVLSLYDLDRPARSFEMPGRLEEISGLAITGDGRLFGHNDERATVHEIDRRTGEVGKRMFLGGDPSIEGDFEGVAIAGERFFLVTSQGLLFEFREVGDREIAPHRVTDLGLGATCEIEGLDYDARDDLLLAACKTTSPERGTIVVHRIPLDPSRPRPPALEIARSQLAAFGVGADFQASSLTVTPAGTIVLVSAAPETLIEVDRAGTVLAGTELPRRLHPQPEGLALASDGTLYIADEQNDAEARVTAYSSRRESSGR